ncbi:RNA-binding post-transcriptional regulator cip2 [Plectosphaerella cucumerina]|uniref:RNA-binding post-transcriptional regulator cip2 n=1 Tax=Plectosphaerella cucumerina TaxID=40658 RepID=A0A8K0WZ16_9PEZI|nr:RNA-binding post-transcriptional regulator cip2 [Plectosphaerella cucumerina]
MSQQQHDMYLDYSAPPNRSPSSSRPYLGGGGGFQSGLSLPRQSQRPFDAPLGSSALYANDRHASGYNQRAMDQLGQQGVMQGGFMPDSPQWSYNPGGVATVNGAMNGGNRQRSVNRRVPIPTNWTDQGGMGMPYSMSGSPLPGGGNDMRYGQGQHDMRGGQGEEQLIPTAIVIKNIPFAVRRETLAALMAEMHLPQPYAFNYHFDNGVFRGLAFANFSSPEDTKVVIEAMNGMDVHGRKLRVEYKKMLPEAERERIEREKRERRGQLEEQHRAPMLHQQPSISTLNSMASGQSRSGGALGDVNLNDPETLEFYTQLTLFRQDSSREILIFPATVTPEQRRQVHILAHHMGLEHQSVGEADSRQIHVVKRHLPSPTSQMHNVPSVGLDYHKKGLIRAATTGDFAEARMAPNNYSHVAGRQGPTLEVDMSNNLRAAKSFADLRSFSPSPSVSSSGYLAAVNNGLPSIPQGSNGSGRYAEYGTSLSQAGSLATPNLTPTTPGTSGTPGTDDSRLLNSLGGLSIGSFESAPHNQPRTAPGAIGSQRPGAGVNSRGGAPERQPRGPEWETSAGFGGRTRTNGHAQRGSDSSDSGARIAASGAHRYL